jgi:hypothetical protein
VNLAERIAYDTNRAAIYADRASLALDMGFKSEAARKTALDHVSTAWRSVRDIAQHTMLAAPGYADDPAARERYFAFPMDLHHWRPKHDAAYPDAAEAVAPLLSLRAAIKAAPVEPKPIREDHPLLKLARSAAGIDLIALRDRRVKQYQDALDLGRRFKGLPVSVNRVWCSNYGGTVWVRLDWYLRGERTPFGTIAAAYDALVREGTIIEESR